MIRRIAVLACACLAVAAGACRWDNDTFAYEAMGKHDLVSILAGRFEQNPPLYYEMRLKQGLEELRENPGDLEQYDNTAVAAERLGKFELALQIISKKKNQLKPLPQDKEGWYRYYANIGTIHAHRSFSQKDAKAKASDLKLAEAEIAKAIDINPDAHFGREKYQLYAIQWLQKGVPKDVPFWDVLADEHLSSDDDLDDAIKGLSGLIRLGGAWESPDIWATLGILLTDKGDGSLGFYAIARVEELEKAGKKSLIDTDTRNVHGKTEKVTVAMLAEGRGGAPIARKENEVVYADLRRQADAWHEARTAYMLERLKQGRHPDWDKTFWSEWKDEPKLVVPTPALLDRISYDTKMWIVLISVLVILIATPIVLFFVVRRWLRKRRLARLGNG